MALSQKPAAAIFGLPELPPGFMLDWDDTPPTDTTVEPPKDCAVKRDPLYKFRIELLREFFAFWFSGEISCKLTGEKGSGKTSFVEQFHSYMNLALYLVSCNGYTEASDLIGKYIPDGKGGLVFQKGPVLRAAVEGKSVCLDEYNLLQQKVANGLNALLEGKSVYIEELGETITPKEGFRVFATQNPEDSPGYLGRQKQDAANRERWWNILVQYAEPEIERKAVAEILMDQGGMQLEEAETFADSLINVANTVRGKYIANNDAADAIPETISTRVLLRWTRAWIIFRDRPAALHVALRSVLTNGLPASVRMAIHEVLRMCTSQEDQPA